MQQVLIISYFYPPCTLTASARPQSWAEYLQLYGYYPTVITRSWETPIASFADISKASGRAIKIDKTDKSKVIYVPYMPTYKDQLYTKYGDDKYSLIRKFLSFYRTDPSKLLFEFCTIQRHLYCC